MEANVQITFHKNQTTIDTIRIELSISTKKDNIQYTKKVYTAKEEGHYYIKEEASKKECMHRIWIVICIYGINDWEV